MKNASKDELCGIQLMDCIHVDIKSMETFKVVLRV